MNVPEEPVRSQDRAEPDERGETREGRVAGEVGDDREVEERADAVLEGYGQSCVTLEPLIKDRMRGMESGQILEVRADDPSARMGIPAWSRLSGNALLGMTDEESGRIRFYLRRK